MPCKTCGKDCKCMRMMSKRGCGTRMCDSDCTCPCNTTIKARNDPPLSSSQGGQMSLDQQTECCCAGQSGEEGATPVGCSASYSC